MFFHPIKESQVLVFACKNVEDVKTIERWLSRIILAYKQISISCNVNANKTNLFKRLAYASI